MNGRETGRKCGPAYLPDMCGTVNTLHANVTR